MMKKRIKAALLAAFIALTLSSCSKKHYTEEDRLRIESSEEYNRKEYGAGEHIVSIDINNRTKGNKQYDYHKGYRVAGLAMHYDSHIPYDIALVYENDYPVECKGSSLDDYGNIIYADFGEPIGYEEKEEIKTKFLKLFNPGEHILSVDVDNRTKGNKQYEYHEGYRVAGVAMRWDSHIPYDITVLYVNTEPVICAITEVKDNKEYYLSFGEPMEKEKILTLFNGQN